MFECLNVERSEIPPHKKIIYWWGYLPVHKLMISDYPDPKGSGDHQFASLRGGESKKCRKPNIRTNKVIKRRSHQTLKLSKRKALKQSYIVGVSLLIPQNAKRLPCWLYVF